MLPKKNYNWYGFLAVFYCLSFFLLHSAVRFTFYLGLLLILCIVRIFNHKEIVKNYKIPTAIGSCLLFLFLPFNYILATLAKNNLFIGVCLLVVVFLAINVFVVNFIDLMQRPTFLSNTVTNKKFNIFLFFAIPFVSFLPYWLQVFPYHVATDTDWQLSQIATNTYSDVHPAAHTLFLKAILQIYNSPATIVFVQILCLAVISGAVCTFFYKKGVSEKLLLPVLIFWSCLWPVQQVTCYIFKDIFYSVGLLLLTFLLIRCIEKKKEVSWIELVLSGIALAAVTLFRHNGIIVTITCVVVFLCFTFKYSKKYLVALLTLLLICIPVKTAVYGAFQVESNDNGTKWALPAKAIVSVVKNNGNYTDEQLKKIEQLMPKEAIEKNYDRKFGQYLIWRDLMQDVDGVFYSFADSLEGKEKLIAELFLELYPKNFLTMTWDMIGSASLMIQFQPQLIEHNAFYMYLLLAAILLLWVKKKRLAVVAFLPCFANIASIVVSNISYESRYGYPTIICFATLLIYAYYSLNKKETATK